MISENSLCLQRHVEPEVYKLGADEFSVVWRVAQCLGMLIGSIGNNECKALQASSPGVTSHSYNACRDECSKSENPKDPMYGPAIASRLESSVWAYWPGAPLILRQHV